MITFIGTGLLGSGFVKAMLKKGEQVSVWNRTASKALLLEEHGAKALTEVTEAVKNADRIHLALSDDNAVNNVLEKAYVAFKPGVVIIDHTTTSSHGASERTQLWKQRGYTYLHAPVFMGPQNAFESTGFMLVSGDQEVIKKLEPVLAGMTGKLINFGIDVSRAAGIKLMGNAFLMFLTSGLSDTLALAKSMNIPASDLELLFSHWNPGAMVPARLKRILAADFENPSWELSMARKDIRLMIQEADLANKQLAILPNIAEEMDRWIAKGLANNDWTVIAKENL